MSMKCPESTFLPEAGSATPFSSMPGHCFIPLQFFFLFPGVQRSVGLFWALHVGYQTTCRDENILLPSCWQQMVFAPQALAPRKMSDSYPFPGVLNATSIPTLPSSPDGHRGNQGLCPTRSPSLFYSPASHPSFTSGC